MFFFLWQFERVRLVFKLTVTTILYVPPVTKSITFGIRAARNGVAIITSVNTCARNDNYVIPGAEWSIIVSEVRQWKNSKPW